MSTKRSNAPSRLNWEMIERDVVNTPGMTLADAAEKYHVVYESMRAHGGPKSGKWLAEQRRNTEKLAKKTDSRTVEIVAQDRAADVTALKEIQFRLQRVAVSFIEMLFPPADAPEEALVAAQNRRDSMGGRQLISAATECARALIETGRHIRLLMGQSTSAWERVGAPDVYIPDSLEVARALEDRSRMAQAALRAVANGEPTDIEGTVKCG